MGSILARAESPIPDPRRGRPAQLLSVPTDRDPDLGWQVASSRHFHIGWTSGLHVAGVASHCPRDDMAADGYTNSFWK